MENWTHVPVPREKLPAFMVNGVMPVTGPSGGKGYLRIVAGYGIQSEGTRTMTNFVNRTATIAAFAVVATAFGAVAAQAQETGIDTAAMSEQTAAYTQSVSLDLSDRFAAPTASLEAKFARVGERQSIKPDQRYARSEESEAEPVRVALAR